jgi:YHS domain-containing protein
MEYQGRGWTDPDSNQAYAAIRASTAAHPLCPICEMEVDPKLAPTAAYKGETYYFCSDEHKELFEKAPEKFASAARP